MRAGFILILSLTACHAGQPSIGGKSGSDMSVAKSSDMIAAATGDIAAIVNRDMPGGLTLNDIYITWYGFNDNSCQVETQHDCNTIAFPKSDGFPVPHDIATEGQGTYDDPNTFATGAMDSGSPAELAPGTRIYVPSVRKYFVMEDQCAECGTEWFSKMAHHVDLWMGPSYGSATGPLNDCEDKLTIGAAYAGTGTIIVDPPSSLPVDTTPLFSNDTCTAHSY